MTVPSDVRELVALLPDMGVEAAIVKKVHVHLLAGPGEVNRWGGVLVDFRTVGKFRAADVVAVAALKRFPESAQMWLARGDLFRRWEKSDGARAMFEQALRLEPEMPGALVGLALLHEQDEDYVEAVRWYRLYLNHLPQSFKVHTNLANCLAQLELHDEAMHHYATALDLDPTYANALLGAAILLSLHHQFDEALPLVEALLAANADDEQGQALRDEILRRPAQPQLNGRQQLVNRPMVFRASLNCGWDGSASDTRMRSVTADRDAKKPFALSALTGSSVDEMRRKAGYRTADIVTLERLVNDIVARTPGPPASRWPVVFISYRWSSQEHIHWVECLAAQIKARGYEVYYDRDMSRGDTRMSVPELVANLAKCNVFLPVLSHEYTVAVEPDGMFTASYVSIGVDEDAWVFDEYRVARRLAVEGRMQWLALWRSGASLPSPFFESNVVDVRIDGQLLPALDRCFPPLGIG